MTQKEKTSASTAATESSAPSGPRRHERTASGSASTSLLRSVFSNAATPATREGITAAPRSGPAWFGSLATAAAATTKATERNSTAAAAHPRKGPGMLKSPAELGRAAGVDEEYTKKQKETETNDTPQSSRAASKTVQASKTVVGMRQRKQVLQQQIASAWKQEEQLWLELAKEQRTKPSSVTALTYQGMEIWIGTHQHVAFICLARTLMILQTLCLEDRSESIVNVRSNPKTGQIVLVGTSGRLLTFRPVPCSPEDVSAGRFRWHKGPVVHAGNLLLGDSNNQQIEDDNKQTPLLVSCSANWKLLVATGHQLAVWDTASNQEMKTANNEAPLVWITRLPAPVQAAAIAGDGQALAVVLQSMEDDEADGVHTFERDWDDGAATAAATSLGRLPDLSTRSLSSILSTSNSNVGIVYKPGPFLVHSAPVTRLSFRGGGSCNSRISLATADTSSTEEDHANDLLLSTASDGTARIFGQQGWKPLTEWVCGKQTRVDWIRGQAAFSLGDLEARQTAKKSRGVSRSASRQSSGDEKLLSATLGLQTPSPSNPQHRMPSIPAHTTPLSQAGAWIAEISWEVPDHEDDEENQQINPDGLPWISLSRLTYLKRGTGDLTPTLLESVSTMLPPVSIMKSSVMTHLDDSLTVEGLWPAWNPFVDVPTESSSSNPVETLRGSAMAFLGLAQTDGYFGDALLQGTQCPPTELRLTAAHPLTGHVIILEFNLHGQDKNLNALELGSPIRSLVNLAAMAKVPTSPPNHTTTTSHGRGALRATVTDGKTIQLHWQQPGTQSLIPVQWLSADIASPPEAIASILRSTKRFRDESLLPVPLALRPCPTASLEDPVQLLQWWPERREILSLHGPRILLAWKRSGSAVVLQVLPPMAERTIPEDGCGSLAYQRLSEAQYLQRQGSARFRRRNTVSDSDGKGSPEEYEVSITPDAQYGLGLRLESLDDGDPATAGSFKKNPDTGEQLPAEKTGMIALGDELVSANGVNLEDKSFDEIINTVREFGASASPGNPIRMRFRQKGPRRDRSSSASSTDTTSKRRTMQHIFGVRPESADMKRSTHSQSSGTISSLDSSHVESLTTSPIDDPCLLARVAPVDGFSTVLAKGHPDRRVLLVRDPITTGNWYEPSPALLIYAREEHIEVHRLSLPVEQTGQVECVCLGSLGLSSVKLLELVKTTQDRLFLLISCGAGDLRFVVVSISKENSSQFSTVSISKQGPVDPETCIFRTFSMHLFATSEPEDGKHRSIKVWTPRLHPGCYLLESTENESRDMEEYDQTVIHLEASVDADNHFVDFCFIPSGFLDSSPLLLAFSKEGVHAYQRQGGSFDWSLVTTILYAYNLEIRSLAYRPKDCLPHLPSSIRICYSSYDEANFLRSDWCPDSIFAQICTDGDGVLSALRKRVRNLLLWLATKGKDILEDFHHLPLLCSTSLGNESESSTAKTGDNPIENQTDVGSPLLHGEQEETTHQLSLLRNVVANYLESPGSESPIKVLWLSSMKNQDVRILLAIIEIVLNPPAFEKVDTCGERFLFASALLFQLADPNDDSKEEKEKKTYSFHVPGVLQRQGSSFSNSRSVPSKKPPFLSSCACISGLLSSSQDMIVQTVKCGLKLDWIMARKLRVSFWIRSDAFLARIAEEIGQTIFRERRDIMECALFFIIARKMRKLRNLAATDKSESGTKFFKFITSHDFASERGRRAAEKNAFSLLRKCRYQVSSAFFLLSEPPALQSALETIITKMYDPDLAFMVARLMESKEITSEAGIGGFSGGGITGFGGVLGGGGGYAGTGTVEPPKPAYSAPERFENWRPSCGAATKKLLVERLLPFSSSDSAMTSLLLLWLEKREEAAWWLSGFLEVSPSTQSGYRLVKDAQSRLFEKLKELEQSDVPGQRWSSAIDKVNALIDFISVPIILKGINAGTRAQYASALLVAEAMIVRGVDTPFLWNLLQSSTTEIDGETASSEKDVGPCQPAELAPSTAPATAKNEAVPQSTIFDAFEPTLSEEKPQPSIFDCFDPQPNATRRATNSKTQSSVSNSFEVTTPPVHTGKALQSSVFDSFDVPPPATKASSLQVSSGKIESSIFDSFDVPVPQRNPPQSSIFDAFDVPSRTSGQTQGVSTQSNSNLDSYDTIRTTNGSVDIRSLKPEANTLGSPKTDYPPVPEVPLCLARTAVPEGWRFLSEELLLEGASRRLCRKIASVLSSFNGDPVHPPIDEFFQNSDSYIPSGASDVLQVTSDVSGILTPVQELLTYFSSRLAISKEAVADATVHLISSFDSHHRGLFSSVLFAALERTDAAEAIVRSAAESVLQGGSHFASALDGYAYRRRTRSTVSSLLVRREAVRTSWQLETCLWLHRGGGLPLSSLALKMAVLAVRMGLTVGSWNRHHETLEALLRCDPDCLVDDDSGRYLWSSLKDPTPLDVVEEQPKKTTSGGWEFLVDCRRTEATEILRESPTGSFIIRPHPSDHGVFTLSFKTNLMPAESHRDKVLAEEERQEQDGTFSDADSRGKGKPNAVRKDDVVQHAIIRLSDSGFRCGSFGPFSSLIELLEAVSASLPFPLRFDLPPQNRVIREEGSQPSPNAVLFRKLALSRADSLASNPPIGGLERPSIEEASLEGERSLHAKQISREREHSYSCFLELLVLSRMRRQLCSIASVRYSDEADASLSPDIAGPQSANFSIPDGSMFLSFRHSQHHAAYWILQPLLSWCRSMEVRATIELSPETMLPRPEVSRRTTDFSEKSIEMTLSSDNGGKVESCDAVLRRLIQRDSGIEFSTLRLVDGGDCSMVVLFSKIEAVKWLVSTGTEESEDAALGRLSWMENERVIEAVDLTQLPLKQRPSDMDEGIRYRIVDPWEVEAVHDREGETRSAVLGRQQYHAFSLGKIALSCENDFRELGGLPLLELWTSSKGGVILSRALASVHPPWERSAGGDLQVSHGQVKEPEPFDNAIRQHLYRNSLFRRLGLPQRFMALMQVELLDLKNLTSPTGSLSLSVYGLLRLKRKGSSGVLSNKTRTLDTAQTPPVRLGKPSGVGPNAPATWGSVVRFRFPLPEGVNVDGSSLDADREALFRGPPSVLQISVYEKKLLVDTALGSADISTDGLWAGGQLEEWVPLRSEKHGGIHWFARIRLTLRFELMCKIEETGELAPPSVGLQRMAALTQNGGAAHEDHKRSMSSPDLLGYLESMVY